MPDWTAETSKAYEDGKHRRYELLFAVNGGAFAVAKLFADKDNRCFLGNLTLAETAFGLACFTCLMGVDIAVFGYRMREIWMRDEVERVKVELGKEVKPNPWRGAFSRWGQGVLFFICLLIIVGWCKVAGGPPLPAPACT